MAEYQSGNAFFRDMGSLTERHKAGWTMHGHSHNFHHHTLICQGRYRCVMARPIIANDGTPVMLPDGSQSLHVIRDVELTPGPPLPIDKDVWHSFECLEGPGLLLCFYSHRDPQTGDVVQDYNGWMEAYR